MVTDIICYHGNSCLMYFVRCTLCKSMHLELEACMRDVNLWGSKKKVIYKSWQKFWLKKRYCCQVYKVSELKLLSWSAQYSLDFSIVSCSRLILILQCSFVRFSWVWFGMMKSFLVGPNHILHFHQIMVVLIFWELSN